ncbi:hypothetical protein ACIOHS_46910 [Streptomyces sp. NPDC088253]|uniref:hypothetical protein n=1 Tax=Streptomyces sp. NPDC088253 TaxID=3365846 RepID=UPI00381157C3
MRNATFDESAWTAADDRLDALLAAAHEGVLDAIQTAQGSGLCNDGARADVVLPKSDAVHPSDGTPTSRPSPIADDALTGLPPLMPGDTSEQGQQVYAALVPDTALVSPALEGALKPLAELLASLSDAAHSDEMSGEFRTWATQGVQRSTSLIQDLMQRSATLDMAEAFFAELESGLARERVWRANQNRYVELVSLLRTSHHAVTYLFEESDDHEKVLV